MGLEENKAVVRRFYDELWNRGNGDAAAELIAPDYIRHDLRPGTAPPGPAGQAIIAQLFRAAFPDLQMTLDALVAEGDLVVGRWTTRGTHLGAWAGQPPTGKAVVLQGVNIFRLRDGKIVEMWNFRDDLGMQQQLGAPVYAGYPAEP